MKSTESPLHHPLLYLAAPLFSSAEQTFNREVARMLSSVFKVYLPQRDGGLLVELVRKGMSAEQAAKQVFAIDVQTLQASDVVFAILDGRTIDEGVAVEIGYAYAIGKACYGLQTDPRRLLPIGNNPMVSGVLERTFTTLEDARLWADNYSKRYERIQELRSN